VLLIFPFFFLFLNLFCFFVPHFVQVPLFQKDVNKILIVSMGQQYFKLVITVTREDIIKQDTIDITVNKLVSVLVHVLVLKLGPIPVLKLGPIPVLKLGPRPTVSFIVELMANK
jgi:hypothetical protein